MTTRSWDDTVPADSEAIADGAERIRHMKVDIEERLGFFLSGYTDLATAVSTIGSTPGTLIIDKDITTAGNVTIPSTLRLQFIPGSQLTVAAGHTFTLNSTNIVAYDLQAFVVTGTLTCAAGMILRTTWFTDIATCEAAFSGDGLMVIPNVENDTDAATNNSAFNVFDQRRTEGSVAGDSRVVIASATGKIASGYLGTPATVTDSSTNAISDTAHSHAVDESSVSQRGIVQLTTSTSSTSTILAATASALKVAYDYAVAAIRAASNLGTGTGVYASKSGTTLQFKSLKVSNTGTGDATGLYISTDSTSITITFNTQDAGGN